MVVKDQPTHDHEGNKTTRSSVRSNLDTDGKSQNKVREIKCSGGIDQSGEGNKHRSGIIVTNARGEIKDSPRQEKPPLPHSLSAQVLQYADSAGTQPSSSPLPPEYIGIAHSRLAVLQYVSDVVPHSSSFAAGDPTTNIQQTQRGAAAAAAVAVVAESTSQSPSQPGAYHTAGAIGTDLHHSNLQEDTRDDFDRPILIGGQASDAGLARAMPVPDQPVVDLEAIPVDMEAAAQRRKARQEQQRRLLMAFSLVAVFSLAAALIFGSVFGPKKDNQGGSSKASNQAAPTGGGVPSSSKMTPSSESPSAAPSGVLDSLLATLPNSTRESLLDPFSPQSKAYNWLWDHPSISIMEEWRKVQLFALATIYHAFPYWRKELQHDWLDYSMSECLWFSSHYQSWLDDGGFSGIQRNQSCNSAGVFQILNLQEAFDLSTAVQDDIGFPSEIALLSNLIEIELTQVRLNTCF